MPWTQYPHPPLLLRPLLLPRWAVLLLVPPVLAPLHPGPRLHRHPQPARRWAGVLVRREGCLLGQGRAQAQGCQIQG